MQRFSKISIFILIGCLLTLAGFGCKGLSEEEKQSVEKVELNYWTVFNDVAELRKLADQYTASRPHVTINIRQVRYEEFDKLFTNALADDVAPDVVSIHVGWLGKYQSRLARMPARVEVANMQLKGQYSQEVVVTKKVNAMPSANAIKANFVSTVYGDVIRDGSIYGLPIALDTMAIYYNKDLLDRAGIPEAPTTWEEFLTAVKRSTQFNKQGDIVRSGVALGTSKNIDNAAEILAMLMMQNGVNIISGGRVAFSDGMDRPTANHPTFEALRFYTDFARPTKEAYSWSDDKPNALTNFTRGNSVFFFGFAYDIPRIKTRAPQMNFEIIPLPQLNPNKPANVADYWVESVVRKSKNRIDAWDFVRFLTSAEAIAQYTEATKRPTPLRSQIASQQTDLQLTPFVSQVLTAKSWYNGNDIDSANRALDYLIDAYKRPYTEKEKPLQRDADLVVSAARVIQQTL